MGVTEYVVPLGERARKRHYHETRRGKVIRFTIQLEIEFRGQWVPVVRYDRAHGRPHVDIYETLRRKVKLPLNVTPAEALTLADEDIKDNWQRYRDEFLRRNER